MACRTQACAGEKDEFVVNGSEFSGPKRLRGE
jgi:hypothetical protein